MSWQLRNSLAAFHHRNFRLFFPGQSISLIGFWMQQTALYWLIYRLTHSPVILGAIVFSQQIPVLLLAVPAGGLVDRTNRHRLIMLTQFLALLQAVLLAVLTYTNRIEVSHIFILSVSLGVIAAFDIPARQSFLVQMVGKEHLLNAIALNSSMFNGARMVGPAVAGFLIARWGESLCFTMNALSYVAVLVSLSLMVVPSHHISTAQSIGKDLGEGFRFVTRTRPVYVMLLLLGVFGITGFSFPVLLPIVADRIFMRGATGLGWLMTAAGSGALIGALFLAGRKGLEGISQIILAGALGFPLVLMLFSFSLHFWLSFGLLCCVGFFMMIVVASINTAIQSIIPDSIRGRIMSFFTTMLIGTAPVGSLIAGTAANWFGVQTTLFASAMICLAGGIWFYRALPGIKTETRRLYLLHNPPPIV